MKLKKKAFMLVLLIVAALFVITGCSSEKTPYQRNDAEGYTISVKFDANGGFFTTNTDVIVDSYNPSQLPKDGDGNLQIALLTPDDPQRGSEAFENIAKEGHFLAGWYLGTKEGNTVTYTEKWDFENRLLTLDANKSYSSAEPVLTLYAAWVPLFEIEFYSYDTGELLEEKTFNPLTSEGMKLPYWDEKTGAINMQGFPERTGYTYDGVYWDAAGTKPVEGDTLTHPGKVNEETFTVENPSLKVYVKWQKGKWYHISTAEQFVKNYSPSGNYILEADLDFADINTRSWPFMHGGFSGSIIGNGHTMKNISIAQSDLRKENTGLFGKLTADAKLQDVNFENVELTLTGNLHPSANFGLLAGTVQEGVTIENVTITGKLKIADDFYFDGAEKMSIDLLCASGTVENVDFSQIELVAGEHDFELVLDGSVVHIKDSAQTDVPETDDTQPEETPAEGE